MAGKMLGSGKVLTLYPKESAHCKPALERLGSRQPALLSFRSSSEMPSKFIALIFHQSSRPLLFTLSLAAGTSDGPS